VRAIRLCSFLAFGVSAAMYLSAVSRTTQATDTFFCFREIFQGLVNVTRKTDRRGRALGGVVTSPLYTAAVNLEMDRKAGSSADPLSRTGL
jgi:hypothetical protein